MIEQVSVWINNIVLICTLALAYLLIIHALIFMIIVSPLALIYYVEKNNPRREIKYEALRNKYIYYIKIVVLIPLTFLAFNYEIWKMDFFYFWKNPSILLILYIFSVIAASQFKTFNPLTRWASYVALFSIIPLVLVSLLNFLLKELFNEEVIKYSLILSFIGSFCVYIFDIFTSPKIARSVADLQKRKDAIARENILLKSILNVFSEYGESSIVKKMINDINDNLFNVSKLISEQKFSEADYLLLRMEIEINQIEEDLKTRIQKELPNDIQTKLNLAEEEFSNYPLDNVNIKGVDLQIQLILSKCKELKRDIKDKKFVMENILTEILPYRNLFTEIENFRNSLRLVRNVDFEMEKISTELDNNSVVVKVLENLEFDVVSLKNNINDLFSDIDSIRAKKFKDISFQDVIVLFRLLMDKLLVIRNEFSFKRASLQKLYYQKYFKLDDVFNFWCFIPKNCSSNKYANGLIVWLPLVPYNGSFTFKLNGVLINFQSERVITMKISEQSYEILSKFSFVGDKAGKGKLTIKNDEYPLIEDNFKFDVLVVPTIWELLRDCFIFLLPSGALCFLAVHLIFNVDISYNALLSAVFGTIISLTIYFYRYLKISGKIK